MSSDDGHNQAVARILVVEDEIFIAMEIERALTSGGFEVLGPVGSIEDALQLLHREQPDAAVLDVTLRDGRVTAVAALLRSRGVPFLLASAEGRQLTESGFFQGVTNLGKPTDMSRMIGEIRRLL
ncbi:response regulator [Shinella yambaruensis]|uniref:Response regulator n=1 Tax=Shinella yambaruensis TaxID=415996 RepID=A0ABQ5ZQB5_9HYPH|nr:response regulator [Shinella yambaruensis]MCJ8023826.1 response regulator [Shinella yambaruensis]MCU7979024.1 response regulator [Shinella yambaruensis]GLR54270.1 response regulator [Shinella yambaruensis]